MAQVALQTHEIAVPHGMHAVHFYERDEDLVEAVVPYLAESLRAGGAGLVIATEAHRRAVERELEGMALEPETLRRDGSLVMLDAAETMSSFMPDGQVDCDAFHRVIGSTVRAAGAGSRPVHAFGEMVAVLWDAGDVLAAIELEKLWNELGCELPFSLLCGYPSASVAGPQHAEALEHVCQLHSAVLSPPQSARADLEVFADFAPEPDTPAAARRLVTETMLERGHHRGVVADAQLVVSELVTNAIVHAKTGLSVKVRCGDSSVRIGVRDGSSTAPFVRDPGPAATFGRGMRLVETLSRDWGVDPAGAGKVVWAELQA